MTSAFAVLFIYSTRRNNNPSVCLRRQLPLHRGAKGGNLYIGRTIYLLSTSQCKNSHTALRIPHCLPCVRGGGPRQRWWGCGLRQKDNDFTAHSPIAYNYREIKFYNTRPQICTLRSVRAGGFQCFKTDLSSAKK